MAQLIQLDEAAQLLGMKPEELVELRSRGEIHGYRDGSTWKFKETELERFADIQGITMGAAPVPGEEVVDMAAPKSGSGLTVDDDLDEIVDIGEIDEMKLEDSGDELLLVDDDDVTEVAKTGEAAGESTMIGKKELELDLDELSLEDDGSGIDLKIEGSSFSLDSGPDVAAAAGGAAAIAGAAAAAMGGDDDEELSLSASDSEISLAPSDSGSELKLDIASGSSMKLSDGSDIMQLDLDGSGTGDIPNMEASGIDLSGDDLDIDVGSDLKLSDDEMELSVESSEELNLDSSDIDLVTESGLGLSDPADSDVTLDPSDSGINLSPSDSGLSLEQTPPELAMTGDDELELGAADELVDFGEDMEIELDDGEGLETDDFVLTPVEGDLGDEDSGSQVIALDTDDLGDEAGLLGDGDVDDMDDGGGLGTVDDGPTIPGPMAPVGVETPYSIWDVVGFGLIMMPLALTGIMVVDLALNIWSFDKPFSVNSQLMDLILGMFGS